MPHLQWFSGVCLARRIAFGHAGAGVSGLWLKVAHEVGLWLDVAWMVKAANIPTKSR